MKITKNYCDFCGKEFKEIELSKLEVTMYICKTIIVSQQICKNCSGGFKEKFIKFMQLGK